ncbi:MAG: pilin [Candidatus Levyibacteriota bacterium]
MPWKDCLFDPSGLQVATLSCVFVLFDNVVTAAFTLAGVIAVIFIILSGIKIIFSSGDAKKFEEGRKMLTFAIIGLLVIFFSILFVNILAYVTGVSCIARFDLLNAAGFQKCK